MIVKLAPINGIEPNAWYEYTIQTDKGFVSIMLKLKNGKFLGYKNFCPHQGRRMDYAAGKFLETDSGNIVCPAHGAEFSPESGLCVNGPCLGESLKPIKLESDEKDLFAIIE